MSKGLKVPVGILFEGINLNQSCYSIRIEQSNLQPLEICYGSVSTQHKNITLHLSI